MNNELNNDEIMLLSAILSTDEISNEETCRKIMGKYLELKEIGKMLCTTSLNRLAIALSSHGFKC